MSNLTVYLLDVLNRQRGDDLRNASLRSSNESRRSKRSYRRLRWMKVTKEEYMLDQLYALEVRAARPPERQRAGGRRRALRIRHRCRYRRPH